MKNYFITITLALFFGLFFTSCSDYLEVQPEDKYLESQVYGTKDGINSVLNNIYLNMAEPNLYGGNLTMNTVELLAQQYNTSDSRHAWYNHGHYLYNQANVMDDFDEIWTGAYASIININELIENLETHTTLSPKEENIIKGEAFGLRAMLHFDLLRLFGPIYSLNPENAGIPYYTKAKAEANPILPASEVMSKILEDLAKAETLLAEDPIITNGVAGSAADPFYANRNLRLNYYAVKALQARVNLYAGNNQKALAAAEMVINEAGVIFPWTEPTEVVSAGGSPDRVFSSEVIFAVQNLNLYNQYKDLFSPELNDNTILAPNSSRLESTFENNENDYRYNSTWILPSIGTKDFRTFFKYADVPDKEAAFRFMQPLIRMTEMYYIAAETATDPVKALEYLNTVRFHRGLIDLPPGVDIKEELQKEYKKEFYGEGQLFFYYKRNNISQIPDGSGRYYYQTISMGPEKYVIPLPESETKFQ